jgi:2-C-methyl-D-erythritol 4-phosphate cytidylyltransferase
MPPDDPVIAAVICAAGSSTRMNSGQARGEKKEYRLMPQTADAGGGLTVLGAAVSAFTAVSQISVIVIAAPDDPAAGEAAARKALPQKLLACGALPPVLFTAGGKTRRASVYNALALLAPRKPDYVLIHDGARPWVSSRLIERLIAAVQKHKAVIPLLPLTETPKELLAPLPAFSGGDEDAAPVFINRHLKRSLTGAAQTPQAFAFPQILAAHEAAALREAADGVQYTDDAEVWAAFCGQVAAIPGIPENRKITVPQDLM